VGSGLILLVIVGAWIAVLVPRGLRKYDVSRSLGSVDRFHDAMRVLSRRDAAAPVEPVEPGDDEVPATGRGRAALGSTWARLRTRRATRPPLTAARRRRRLLLVLVLIALGTLLGAVLGPLWVLAPHLVADLLLAAFLIHLRRTAASRADRDLRAAMERRPARRPAPRPAARPVADAVGPAAPVPAAPRLPVHVAGIPDRMPPRVDPVRVPAPQELPAARGAQGEAWSPVPVPTPTYLSAPTAPRPVMDLTRAAANGGLSDAERELGIVDEGPQLDEILDRRRAVNDW
jgi:hypothetical protein